MLGNAARKQNELHFILDVSKVLSWCWWVGRDAPILFAHVFGAPIDACCKFTIIWDAVLER